MRSHPYPEASPFGFLFFSPCHTSQKGLLLRIVHLRFLLRAAPRTFPSVLGLAPMAGIVAFIEGSGQIKVSPEEAPKFLVTQCRLKLYAWLGGLREQGTGLVWG